MYELSSKAMTGDRMWSANDSIKTSDTNDPNNPQKDVKYNQTIRHCKTLTDLSLYLNTNKIRVIWVLYEMKIQLFFNESYNSYQNHLM